MARRFDVNMKHTDSLFLFLSADRLSSGEERRCSVCAVCRMQVSSGMHERSAGTVLKYLRDAEAGTHEGASAKAEGATVIILVDFENTHASGLEGYTYLNESDTLVMYYSDENSAVTKGVVDDLRKNGVHVRLVKLLKQHSNALDMYIASTTGMFLDSGEKICIVSKDHGYAAVRDFWHSLRGAEILLGETIKQCLLSSELNDEARIRLCKEREQKAMLVDAFTTMNTIPTRPTLSRSNQRRRRNDTRNFMEVSEPVAILPNPLMTETPADQLAKELSSAAAKSETTAREAQAGAAKTADARDSRPDTGAADGRDAQKRTAARDAQMESAAQQETAMTTSVSSDNASDVAAATEAEASTAAGRSERGGRGRNGRNRRNDQNHRNERNDRPERDDRNVQDRADATAAEKTGSEQRSGRDADARTQNTRSTREQSGNRREQSSTAEQNTTSEPSQERFGGYDGIMKMNEASRIALDKRQEREDKKDEQGEPSAAKNRNHPNQNTQSVSDEKQRTSENRKKEEKQHASGDVALDATSGTALTQMKQETAALVKAEKKTTAVAKVDPNRVQFVWDPVTRSMKRVGGPAEESTEKKDDAAKTEAAEKNAEAVDEKTADRKSEKDATADVKVNADATEKDAADAVKNQGVVTTKTLDVYGASAEKDATEELRMVDVTTQASDVAVETAPDVAVEKNAEAKDNATTLVGAAEKNAEVASSADASLAKTDVETTEDVVAKTAADFVTADDEKATATHAQAGQPAVTDEKKSEATKKTGAHRKAKKSTSVKKESDASEKPVDAKKSASSSKPEGKKKADAVKHEEDSEKNSGASETKAAQNTANASEKPEINTENTASASKKSTKKKSAKKSAKKDDKKESAEQKSDADAQPVLEMTEEDIQLTKKKYSEGINTLHTYYVRLMKAFGREQGRAIYESTKKSVQEDIKARKAQLAAQNAQPTTTEAEEN